MLSTSRFAGLAFALFLIATAAANADVYNTANFTIGVFGGSANSQAPFSSVIPQGSSYTGSLVFDQTLVPGSGSGFVNVFFSSFPDIGQIPPATALTIPLGSLPAFTLASATQGNAAIQYNNGAFNGLFYISDFNYNGNPYELQIQGGTWDIVAGDINNPTFNNLVSGYINLSLSNITPYTPPPPASSPGPLPGAGLAGLAALVLASLYARSRA
jgi:hypothetical protein